MNGCSRQEKGHGKSEYPKNEFLTVFLPRFQGPFFFSGEGCTLCSLGFGNEFPKNDSAAQALRSLRLVVEVAFRTLHWAGIIPAQNPSVSLMSLRILSASVTRF